VTDDETLQQLAVLIRRIVREELDNYDRDKGLTPRTARDGSRSPQPLYRRPYPYWP
jgi:hypothetical protein